MSEYSKQEQTVMLNLARISIASVFQKKDPVLPDIPMSLRHKRACFVTLTKNNVLRGCIGHILPVQKLWKDITENARAAAFYDPRFSPLQKDEFSEIRIEISILTLPKAFSYQNTKDLLLFLGTNHPGVIVSKGARRAVFLPQVWEDLADPKEFLSHLCIKANLDPHAWLHGVVIEYFSVEKITD